MSDAEVLERFHRALIEEIQTQRPEYLTGPFTVAEIYQNLVPYRSHRDRIGVEMNADYEDALLRLLAGEGGFLVLESEPALRDIRAELKMAKPNTGVYREFAAVDVRLNQSRLDLSAAASDEISDLVQELNADQVPVPLNELAPSEASPEDLGIVPPGVDIFAGRNGPSGTRSEEAAAEGELEEVVEEEVEGEEGELSAPVGGLQPEFVEAEPAPRPKAKGGDPCQWCRAELPRREKLNFCPFCGTDLSLFPCPSCGDEVASGWRFCVSCGEEVASS